MTFKRSWAAAVAVLVVAGFFAFAHSHRSVAASAIGGAPAGLRIDVDLSKRVLSVIENGGVTATYPVAIGRPSYPTPTGSFAVHRIIWNPSWVPPDAKWARKKTPKEPGQPGNPMGRVKIFF